MTDLRTERDAYKKTSEQLAARVEDLEREMQDYEVIKSSQTSAYATLKALAGLVGLSPVGISPSDPEGTLIRFRDKLRRPLDVRVALARDESIANLTEQVKALEQRNRSISLAHELAVK